MSDSPARGADLLSRDSTQGRLALLAVTLGSAVAILDGSIVNVALATIGRDLDASLAQLQWIINGYMLSLAALILVGGSLGDRLGRRRVYLWGTAAFAIASASCGVAQSPGQLVAFRVLQGIGGALATPGALAIIQSSFRSEDRASAIGTWAGTSGVAAAVGPFVGGWLVQGPGWRWIFLLNVPLCGVVVWLCLRTVPESRDAESAARFDVGGAGLTVVGLGALTYAFTAAAEGVTPAVWAVLGVGIVTLGGFVAYELRVAGPMVPMGLFRSRAFAAANAMTFLVYGSLGVVFLLLTLQLQVSGGYSPLEAGLAGLPVTVALLLLSSRAAALSARIGPRVPMAAGPLLGAVGVVLMAPVGSGTAYVTGVLPGMVLFALGLAGLVSPLTATVLAAAPDHVAGVASGINNAVARAGSLLAVAALPAAVGLSGTDYTDPSSLTDGYRLAMWLCAGLLALGGVVSWFGLGRRGR